MASGWDVEPVGKNGPLILWLIVVVIIWAAVGGFPVYIAAPFEARVVDADTRVPIEGVVVVANWQLVKGGLDGARVMDQLEVKESVTDSDGRFRFRGFVRLNPKLYELRSDDPQLLLFKAGYEALRTGNHYPGAGTRPPWPWVYRKSQLDETDIRLKRYVIPTDLPNEGRGHSLYSTIPHINPLKENCHWTKMPHMFLAMERERERVKQLYPMAIVGLPSILELSGRRSSHCGSPREFFSRYEP